jgi:hypothetical protein
VAKSSVSLWVRDLARPARLSYEECRKRAAEGAHRYWAAERPARAAARATTCAAAAAQIGTLTDRELLIAGAIAYWCEGGKSKPHSTAGSKAGLRPAWPRSGASSGTATRTPGARDPLIPPSRFGRYRVRTAAAAAMLA